MSKPTGKPTNVTEALGRIHERIVRAAKMLELNNPDLARELGLFHITEAETMIRDLSMRMQRERLLVQLEKSCEQRVMMQHALVELQESCDQRVRMRHAGHLGAERE